MSGEEAGATPAAPSEEPAAGPEAPAVAAPRPAHVALQADRLERTKALTAEVAHVYAFCRSFSCILRLSPFGLKDVSAAIALERPCALLDEIHVAMIRMVLAEAAISPQSVPWGKVDGGNLDSVTWPEILRRYLVARHGDINDEFQEPIVAAATALDKFEYYTLPHATKVLLLEVLIDDIVTSSVGRSEMETRAVDLEYEKDDENDVCEVCGDGGNLICCDSCPRTFHCKCIGQRESQLPEEWHCPECAFSWGEIQDQIRVETLAVGKRGVHIWMVDSYVVHNDPVSGSNRPQFKHCETTESIEQVKQHLRPAQLRNRHISQVLQQPIPDGWKEAALYINHYRNAPSKHYYLGALSGRNLPAALCIKQRPADWTSDGSNYSFRSHLGTVIGQILHIGRLTSGLLEGQWSSDPTWHSRWIGRVREACCIQDAKGPLIELEAAMRWISGCVIGEGWCNKSTCDALGDDLRVKKAKRIPPKPSKQKKAKGSKALKQSSTAKAEIESFDDETKLDDAEKQAIILQMDPAWNRKGHEWLGLPLMRAEYTNDKVFAGYVTGEAIGWLPAEQADFISEKTGQPAGLWKVLYRTGTLKGEVEDLEEHEMTESFKLIEAHILRKSRQSKPYWICAPGGKPIEPEICLSQFCMENDLSKACMSNVALGRTKNYKGWTCRYIEFDVYSGPAHKQELGAATEQQTPVTSVVVSGAERDKKSETVENENLATPSQQAAPEQTALPGSAGTPVAKQEEDQLDEQAATAALAQPVTNSSAPDQSQAATKSSKTKAGSTGTRRATTRNSATPLELEEVKAAEPSVPEPPVEEKVYHVTVKYHDADHVPFWLSGQLRKLKEPDLALELHQKFCTTHGSDITPVVFIDCHGDLAFVQKSQDCRGRGLLIDQDGDSHEFRHQPFTEAGVEAVQKAGPLRRKPIFMSGRLVGKLPNSMLRRRDLRKAARKAGVKHIPGVLYDGEFGSSSNWYQWRADVSDTTTVPQLALQVQKLYSVIQWDELRRQDNELEDIINKKTVDGQIQYLTVFRIDQLEQSVRDERAYINGPTPTPTPTPPPSNIQQKKTAWLPLELLPLALVKKFEMREKKRRAAMGLHCICRTLYDETRAYVKCVRCKALFHPECIGARPGVDITCNTCMQYQKRIEAQRAAEASQMAARNRMIYEFQMQVAQARAQKHAELLRRRMSQRLVCVCQSPYDPLEQYVQCMECRALFHYECVGVPKPAPQLSQMQTVNSAGVLPAPQASIVGSSAIPVPAMSQQQMQTPKMLNPASVQPTWKYSGHVGSPQQGTWSSPQNHSSGLSPSQPTWLGQQRPASVQQIQSQPNGTNQAQPTWPQSPARLQQHNWQMQNSLIGHIGAAQPQSNWQLQGNFRPQMRPFQPQANSQAQMQQASWNAQMSASVSAQATQQYGASNSLPPGNRTPAFRCATCEEKRQIRVMRELEREQEKQRERDERQKYKDLRRKEKEREKEKRRKHCVCKEVFDLTRNWIKCKCCHSLFHAECIEWTGNPTIAARDATDLTFEDWPFDILLMKHRKPDEEDSAQPSASDEDAEQFVCQKCTRKQLKQDKLDLQQLEDEPQPDRYCICRTTSTEGEWIECDRCDEWYHPECLKMTPAEARAAASQTVWVCKRCKAKDRRAMRIQELKLKRSGARVSGGWNGQDGVYCICEQPYDSSRSYVGCIRCDKWFHVDCVRAGRKVEDDLFGFYLCNECNPKCQATTTTALQGTSKSRKQQKQPRIIIDQPLSLFYGNEHRLDEGYKPHYWTVFVRGAMKHPLLALLCVFMTGEDDETLHQHIEEVTFYLHPDFRPSVVHVKTPPFQVTRRGWGAFEMDIDIKMHDGSTKEVTHYLNFNQPCTSNRLEVKQAVSLSKRSPAVHAADKKKQALTFGNEYRPLDSDDVPHEWTTFVRGQDAREQSKVHGVRAVTFHLHPDFNPSSVCVRKPPFQITRQGWGAFDVKLDIEMQDGTTKEATHPLMFDQSISFTTLLYDIKPKPMKMLPTSRYQDDRAKLVKNPSSTPSTKKRKLAGVSNQVLTFGNEYTPLDSDDKPHEWTVFVRGQDAVANPKERHGVDQVTFYLHPDFRPSVVHVKTPPFQLTRRGWGAFEMDIDIVMQDGSTQQVTHDLNFNEQITYDTVRVNAANTGNLAKLVKNPSSTPSTKKRKLADTPTCSNQVLTFGNEYTPLDSDDKPHEWTVFVRGQDAVANPKERHGVDQVTFYLHPDFRPSVVHVKTPPFQLTRRGWGAFEMDIDIVMQDGSTQQVTHDLNFNEQIAYDTVRVNAANTGNLAKLVKNPSSTPSTKKRKLADTPTCSNQVLTFGNEYTPLDSDDKPHEWTVFVRGQDAVANPKERHGVDQVTFYLHPDFRPSVVHVKTPPFQLTRRGWGAFEMDIDIVMQDGSTQQVTHDLNFNEQITYDTVQVKR